MVRDLQKVCQKLSSGTLRCSADFRCRTAQIGLEIKPGSFRMGRRPALRLKHYDTATRRGCYSGWRGPAEGGNISATELRNFAGDGSLTASAESTEKTWN